jgi:hypothetical protein
MLYILKIIKVFRHHTFHESMIKEFFKNYILDKMFKIFHECQNKHYKSSCNICNDLLFMFTMVLKKNLIYKLFSKLWFTVDDCSLMKSTPSYPTECVSLPFSVNMNHFQRLARNTLSLIYTFIDQLMTMLMIGHDSLMSSTHKPLIKYLKK